MGSIRLHPKYGLNPTIPVCIICGKEVGEIALLGAACRDQAPMYMVTSVRPCGECREKHLKEGVLLVEADMEQRRGKKTPRPTGRLLVIKSEAYRNIFNTAMPPEHIAYVEPGVLDQLLAAVKEAGDESGAG